MWANTHGLEELYGHMEFELVISMPAAYAAQILNLFGERVRDEAVFEDREVVEGILKRFPVHLKRMSSYEKTRLRVIVPDANGRWPEDEGCEPPYSLQIMSLEALQNESYRPHNH